MAQPTRGKPTRFRIDGQPETRDGLDESHCQERWGDVGRTAVGREKRFSRCSREGKNDGSQRIQEDWEMWGAAKENVSREGQYARRRGRVLTRAMWTCACLQPKNRLSFPPRRESCSLQGNWRYRRKRKSCSEAKELRPSKGTWGHQPLPGVPKGDYAR